jgi:hypothetical protein
VMVERRRAGVNPQIGDTILISELIIRQGEQGNSEISIVSPI